MFLRVTERLGEAMGHEPSLTQPRGCSPRCGDPGRNGLLLPGTGAPGETGDNRVRELEGEVNKLSSDLKNAKEEIDVLQGRLEKLNLVNMNNIEQYVDSKVANLTFVVNSLDGKCSSKCPRQEQIQSLPGMYNNVFLSFVDECYITQ